MAPTALASLRPSLAHSTLPILLILLLVALLITAACQPVARSSIAGEPAPLALFRVSAVDVAELGLAAVRALGEVFAFALHEALIGGGVARWVDEAVGVVAAGADLGEVGAGGEVAGVHDAESAALGFAGGEGGGGCEGEGGGEECEEG